MDPKNGKDCGQIYFANSDFSAKISHFCSESRLGYYECEFVFRDDTSLISSHENGYDFLWFNFGETMFLGDTTNKFCDFGAEQKREILTQNKREFSAKFGEKFSTIQSTKFGDKRGEIGKNSALLGRTQSGFTGISHYKAGRVYKNQCILLDRVWRKI